MAYGDDYRFKPDSTIFYEVPNDGEYVLEIHDSRYRGREDFVYRITIGELPFNDDHEDLESGLNTHEADSHLVARLPADGACFVYIGDTARQGGEEYGCRLRLSAPQPDVALRVVPSSVRLRSRSTATVSVQAIRKDGFTGPIKVTLKNPPVGFSAFPITLSGTQAVARLVLRGTLVATKEPVHLTIVGSATVASGAPAGGKPRFTRQQIAGRSRQLKLLFEEGLLTDDFYDQKVAQCEAAQ